MQPSEAWLIEAFEAWNSRRAYVDNNGNYRVRVGARTSGPIAPWNRTLKKAFSSVSEFHNAAQAHWATKHRKEVIPCPARAAQPAAR